MKKIAILGPEGTFSDDAAKRYLKKEELSLELTYYPTIDDAFHQIGKECDWGIIPLENTLDGYVQRTLDLLLEMDVHAVAQITIPVQFSLVANISKPEELKRLYVQFKANGQCRKAIDKLHPAEICTTESNMESYYCAEQGIAGDGAVIPHHMLSQSKAPFHIENITDAASNYTRFLVIRPGKQQKFPSSGLVRVPLYIMPETDYPGLLYDILKSFHDHQMNLASIMSRPTKKIMGTYNFYLELTIEAEQISNLSSVLDTIKLQHQVKVLGIFPEK